MWIIVEAQIVGRLMQDECPGHPVSHIYHDVRSSSTVLIITVH